MGIKSFSIILLLLSAGAYFIPVENKVKEDDGKDIPLVVFENPLMYTVTKDSVSRIVHASHAVRYKNRDEMFNVDVILKNKDPEKKFLIEKLKAETLVKKGDEFTLKKKVKYERDNFIDLNTDELYYNLKTKVAYNNLPYDGNYYNHSLKGTNLYLDGTKNNMKSKDVHFVIDTKNKK